MAAVFDHAVSIKDTSRLPAHRVVHQVQAFLVEASHPNATLFHSLEGAHLSSDVVGIGNHAVFDTLVEEDESVGLIGSQVIYESVRVDFLTGASLWVDELEEMDVLVLVLGHALADPAVLSADVALVVSVSAGSSSHDGSSEDRSFCVHLSLLFKFDC